MKVYNKGQRSFLVPIESVKLPEGYQPKPEQKTFPIGPEDVIEVEDKIAPIRELLRLQGLFRITGT